MDQLTDAEYERLVLLRNAAVAIVDHCDRVVGWRRETKTPQDMMQLIGDFIGARRLMYWANDIQAPCVSYHADQAVERLRECCVHQDAKLFPEEVRADEH